MPVVAVFEQPVTNAINAVYRPIVLKVRVEKLGTGATPPVVYCDIYLNDIFYRSIMKTICNTINTDDCDFHFDIQDPCQEKLTYRIPDNGFSEFINDASGINKVYCKFRSSDFDANGFIEPEGTPPVQGTGLTVPTPGTGTQSNIFYIVNAVLQHEQNQNLATHLSYFKSGTWSANAWPLTHRASPYKLCPGDSDFFPIVMINAVPLKCIRLKYKLKGATSYSTAQKCFCYPIAAGAYNLPDGSIGEDYLVTIPLSGTGPYVITSTTIPSWMTASIVDTNLVLSGMPDAEDTDIDVNVTIENGCGNVILEDTIDVGGLVLGCVAIETFPAVPVLPDAVVGADYFYDFPLRGTPPHALGAITKPAWMTITLSGSTLQFRGTPLATASGVSISVVVTNCISGSKTYTDTINVVADDTGITGMQIINASSGSGTIVSVTPVFFFISSGDPFPLSAGQAGNAIAGSFSGIIHVQIGGSPSGNTLTLKKNGTTVSTIGGIGIAGTYNFSSQTFLATDSIEIKLL